MGEFAPDRVRDRKRYRPDLPLPRTSRIIAGFLLAGLIGLTAYFLPVLQSSATPVVNSGGAILDPIAGPTTPFTVLLLGSDDDSKFAADQYNTQSMILVRVDPASKQVTMLSRDSKASARSTPPIRRVGSTRPSPRCSRTSRSTSTTTSGSGSKG
jgi:hypothetical protein